MERSLYDGNRWDITDRVDERFLAVNSCGVHVSTAVRTVRMRGRADFHLLYVESGELVACVRGNEERVHEGGFVIYPPREAQDYWQNGGVCYWVHFSGQNVAEILSAAGLSGIFCFHGGRAEPSIARRLERMLYEEALRQPNRELMLAAELATVLAEIGRSMQQGSLSCGDERLRSVVVHMNKHYHEEIDMDGYAGMCCLSKGRFNHLFRERVGVPPYAYILSLRLNRAAEQLLSSEKPVSQIAREVGFSDPLYFSRLFRKRNGASPEEFRRREDRGQGG